MQAKHWPAAAALLLLLAALTLLAPTQGHAYEIRKGHPRIFFDKQTLAEIAKRCDKGGPCEAGYEGMKQFLTKKVITPGATYYPAKSEHLPAIALTYLIEKQLGRDATRYLTHIRDNVWKAKPKDFSQAFGWNAILYDWLYEDLTPEERKQYAAELGPRLRQYTKRPEITLDGGTYWYNQTWGANMTTSWCRDGIAPKTMVALALLGENSPFEADARQWLDSFAQRMPEEFVSKFDLLSGYWPEGPEHGSMSYEPFIAWEAWRFATGQDLFAKVAPTGYHREAPYWFLYGRVPHSGRLPHMDDCGPGCFMGGSKTSFTALHAARYRDPITQGQASRAMAGGADWTDLIFYTPGLPTLERNDLPLAYHLKGSGLVFMRSGWDSPDDTWAMFTAGPYFTAYGMQGKNGNFQITKDGTLAGLAGYRRDTPRAPSSQNIVLVYDPAEKFYHHTYGGLRNDGGSLMPIPYHVKEPLERGKILAYEHTDAYTYIGADLTKAYAHLGMDPAVKEKSQSEKMKSFTRQFLYVRGNPEFFVIYDRVEATNPAFPKTWLLHLQDEPQITAGGKPLPVAAEGPGFKTYQGADTSFNTIVARPDRDARLQTTKRGALAVRTLLPENARVTKRGGTGFELWGNPHAPQVGNLKHNETGISAQYDLCLWRIEVEHPDQAAYQRFLHVLVPYGDAEGKSADQLSPAASAYKLVKQPDREGVRFELDGATWEITFATTGPMAGQVEIRRPGGAPVSARLTTEVKPNPVPPGLAISGQTAAN